MKYRKKPVVIEAMKFDGTYDSQKEIESWSGISSCDGYPEMNQCDSIRVQTLEGMMTAKPGDYIIKGVKGEFYPCKADIFEMTYEKVEEQK